MKAGQVLGQSKMSKHFTCTFGEGKFAWERKEESIQQEVGRELCSAYKRIAAALVLHALPPAKRAWIFRYRSENEQNIAWRRSELRVSGNAWSLGRALAGNPAN